MYCIVLIVRVPCWNYTHYLLNSDDAGKAKISEVSKTWRVLLELSIFSWWRKGIFRKPKAPWVTGLGHHTQPFSAHCVSVTPIMPQSSFSEIRLFLTNMFMKGSYLDKQALSWQKNLARKCQDTTNTGVWKITKKK